MKHLEIYLTQDVKDRCTEPTEHFQQNLQMEMNAVTSLHWGQGVFQGGTGRVFSGW